MGKTFDEALWAAFNAGQDSMLPDAPESPIEAFERWRREWAGDTESEPQARCFGNIDLWWCIRDRGHEGDHEFDAPHLNDQNRRIGAMTLRQIADREPGWDDVCKYCPKHRYQHRRNENHPFISEEQ